MAREKSKTSLFLMEMMIVILFFSLCAAICVQLFASARQLSEQSEALSNATMIAQSGAEAFKATGGNPEQIAVILGGVLTEDGVAVTYAENCQMVIHCDGTRARIEVGDFEQDRLLFSLEVMTHQGGGGFE